MALSTLSAECIISNLDANKRIHLSMIFPSLRKLEKSVSLKMDILQLSPSSITVNFVKYVFGEIRQIPEDASEFMGITMRNSEGGFPWRSLKDDVVEFGDVDLPNRDVSFLESQRFEIMEDLRGAFMESLEKYLNDQKGDVNPMDLLEELEDSEYSEFDKKAKEVFETLRGSSNSPFDKIWSLRDLFENVKNGEVREGDELAEKYPKAFELMKRKEEEVNNNLLSRLVYPQVQFPFFNQFSIFKKGYEEIFSNRLPDNLNLRKAFKKFTSIIFGNRKNILQVQNFEINGNGIVGLPVDFQNIEVEELEFMYVFPIKNWKVYQKLVSKVGSLVIWGEAHLEAIDLEMTKNCSRLFIFDFTPSLYKKEGLEKFGELQNENIFVLNHCQNKPEDIINLIDNWTKLINRKVGSKLFIQIMNDNISILSSSRLAKIGFSSEVVEGNQQFSLCPQGTDGKVVLKVIDDIYDQLPSHFRTSYGYREYFFWRL